MIPSEASKTEEGSTLDFIRQYSTVGVLASLGTGYEDLFSFMHDTTHKPQDTPKRRPAMPLMLFFPHPDPTKTSPSSARRLSLGRCKPCPAGRRVPTRRCWGVSAKFVCQIVERKRTSPAPSQCSQRHQEYAPSTRRAQCVFSSLRSTVSHPIPSITPDPQEQLTILNRKLGFLFKPSARLPYTTKNSPPPP